jgi:hypothetical protein
MNKFRRRSRAGVCWKSLALNDSGWEVDSFVENAVTVLAALQAVLLGENHFPLTK